MNANDIRDLAIERIARAEYEIVESRGHPDPSWAELPPEALRRYRSRARHAVDVLGDLLSTGVEYRVDPCDCQPCDDCETAALAEGSVRQRRFVGPWEVIE